ncbi:MAG TPA: peptidyl-alpha-hydroxyglycine alpha-amidating lyase family protein [Candidatus Acidoferrales bacterium]|nr:peptidyl-alpha-hydroxyglycine alpha-amidating lyase family protein [Candidatus Acidoferrales bacterium]
MKKLLVLCVCAAAAVVSQTPAIPRLSYSAVADFFVLPAGANFGEAAGVAVNSKGHVYVFHRGERPLMEFDANGKFIRALGEGLFTTPHGVRVDAQDNLWTTDVGSHVVLKLSPDGRVLMVLGRKGVAGEDIPNTGITLFNKPSDVAFDRAENIYVSDGYGNSRVVKFDKNGKFLTTWGTKGTGPGQFDLPHAIVVDGRGRVFVADRENSRIQVFDSNGNYQTEWKHLGQPWGLALTHDGALLVADGLANRVVKADLSGSILGTFGGPGKAPGDFLYAHAIAVGPQDEIYVSEILNWRVQKFIKQ